MQAMRQLLDTSLGKALEGLTELDRLSAAWPVAAGHAVAHRSAVTAFALGVATVTVPDMNWQRQLRSTAQQLRGDLARISRVPLTDILFVLPAGAETPGASAKPYRRKSA
jgi:predicted nucleic acid-binding Zn ribbon protein